MQAPDQHREPTERQDGADVFRAHHAEHDSAHGTQGPDAQRMGGVTHSPLAASAIFARGQESNGSQVARVSLAHLRMPLRATWPHGTRFALPVAALACVACASKPFPDPRLAAQRWADAIEKGDDKAMYSLLTDASRRMQGPEGVARLLAQDRKELSALANAAAAPNARLDTSAEVSYADDRSARVVLEDGQFRVAAVGALPAGAQNPRDALRQLREVLARRSFAGLLRVVTRDTAESLEGSLQDLVSALAEPATIEVQIEGRRATVQLPGGHTVTLEHEDGVWRVKDFD